MIDLPGISVKTQIYESANSLVYRAVSQADRTDIILKVLKQDYPTTAELVRYKTEYEITRSLNLEGVIKAYNQQDYQRTLVIVLEDFGGESLKKLRESREISCPMPLAEFLRLAIAITEILGRIHAANVIHKDINPSNIVLNPQTGILKIIDFGIATRLTRINPTFKNLNVLEGTLAYMSPEQTGRMNRSLDYRTDFYSLGVTFYELLTGQLPFATADVLELVHCHIAKQPIPVHEINLEIHPIVSAIVMKLMAKNAEERYQSAWGIKTDLEKCLKQLETKSCLEAFPLGLQDISDKFQIPQKLYGRETEVETLLTAFERVAATNNHQSKIEMMLVAGYSGIGKSYLVHEIYKPITEKCGYFISGKFDQFKRNIPYSAVVNAFAQLMQQLLSESEVLLQRWREKLLTALGANGQVIIDVIPEVESIVGKQSAVPDLGATESQNRFNRVFQNFIRVFCSHEHPLVIFLDDLQWADSATLKLIELMMSDRSAQDLFLIGAYRDNGVNSTHPLMMTLEELKKEDTAIAQITLAPLKLEAIALLIADTLHSDTSTVKPLTELVLRKTGGNPFFINEFLKTLYAENLITFSLPQDSQFSSEINNPKWTWDMTEIEAKNITDNVVELTVAKLKKLPSSTQQVLRLAACVGADFDLSTLSIICENSPSEIFPKLVVAIQSGLILPTSDVDEQLLVQDYKFLHDRVQQAAYALIDESQKRVVHLQIGRSLLEKTLPERRPERRPERLFEIVDHLNHGIELVSVRAERDEIAKLNLMAAQKARGEIAYSVAKNYLVAGRTWLATSSWQTNYDLTLALYSETTEVAYLCGEFEQVEYWTAIVLQKAETILDTINVYEVKIQAAIAQSHLLEAINTGLQVLQQLGNIFPEKPSQSDIQLELDTILSRFDNKAIQDSIQLPEMTKPEKLAAMRILSRITLVAYHAAPDLVSLLVFKQVNLSIQYGNTFVSPFAYANFGLILCGMVGNIEAGYEFGQLALRLLAHLKIHSLKARTLFIITNFIIHWKEHIRETSESFLEAYQIGLETGDLEFAAYCAFTYCLQFFIVGKELAEVEHEMATYCEAIRQIKQTTSLTWTQIFQQSVLNLMGCSVNPSRLVGEAYNEENRLPHHEIDAVILFLVHFNKLILCYIFSDYAQASENATIAESYALRVIATPLVPLYYFYDSLARLAAYPKSNAQIQSEILERIALSQKKIKHWADYAPMNYLHKYHLVEAEKARVLGQVVEAMDFYECAIKGAKDNEYIQEEALAYELAAKFYLARGMEKFAQTYMKEAHYCYERWGAKAKVADLEVKYPQLLTHVHRQTDTQTKNLITTTSSNSSEEALDLASVMKASLAISGEIELDRLLRSLMQILIENAGAQTGCLILENSGEWAIEASSEFNDGENVFATQVLQSIPVVNHLPESIINYVIQTYESVILNDATCEGNFINEQYIQHNQTQSLLCLPLLNQSKLVGVLYLENQLATGVFTPERSQVLHLLSTQAAIAIENAKLYSKLRASESQMAQFLEAVPVAIAVVDAAGRPYYANRRRIELIGKEIDPAVTADRFAEVYQFYRVGTERKYPSDQLPIVRALNGERITIDDMEIHRNDAIIPIEAWATPVYDEQSNVAYAIVAFQDTTDRKQAEKLLADYNRTLEQQVAERTAALHKSEATLRDVYDELRLREQELRLIANALPVLISYVDINQRYRFVNQTYEEWFKCSRDEILGKHSREFLGEAIYQIAEPHISRALAGQTVSYEAEIPYPIGKKYISATLIPDFDSDAHVKGHYGLITDISDRKRAEEASILEERNRMAREIHDTLAQAFTGILVHVGASTQVITDDLEATQAHLEMIEELARIGLAEARRSVTALRPQLLEDGSLQSALHRLVTQMRSATDTAVIHEIKGTDYPLRTEVENNLLRIGQEALTNAVRYGGGDEIRVELVYEKTQCLLRVKDNGQGFGVGSISSVGGFGLLGMSERAEQIGAQLTIKSQPGQGTEIVVIVNRE